MFDANKYMYEGAKHVLEHLIQLAQQIEGAEVWRALFAEQLANLKLRQNYGQPFKVDK